MSERMTQQFFFHSFSHTRLFGVNAIGAGRCQRKHRERYPILYRDYPSYCLIHISRGRAFHEAEGVARRCCEEGDSFLLIPGVRHGYGVIPGEDFEETWIAFEGPAIDLLFKSGELSRDRSYFAASATPGMGSLIQEAYRLAQSGKVVDQRRLPALYLQILTELIPIWGGEGGPPVWIGEAQHHLTEAALGSLDLETLASRFNISYSSFRSLFRKATGIAPRAYHLAQKMNAACSFLSQGATVAEAAKAVGMADPFYFSRLFKKHIGVPPSRYR
ncbi:MAG: helix-turn-helix transcriptional regulator [Planctomycetota bacterium]